MYQRILQLLKQQKEHKLFHFIMKNNIGIGNNKIIMVKDGKLSITKVSPLKSQKTTRP